MSLETKIEKLTNAIEELTKRLHAVEAATAIPAQAEAPAVPTADKLEEAYEEENAKAKPAISHEEVQQLCLKIVREDRSKKTALKDVLAEYGATLVADVPADKLEELKTKLESV